MNKRITDKFGMGTDAMSKKKIKETEVGKVIIDKITQKPSFDYYQRPTVGARFFVFKEIGDSIEGRIIGHSITNIRRNSSYPIQLNSGEVVEIFANKTLHKIIRDYELVFQRVKIVFIGRDHNTWGHAAKVYRVFKIQNGHTEEQVSKKGVKRNARRKT